MNSCGSNTLQDIYEYGQSSVEGGADYNCSKLHGSRGPHVTAEHDDNANCRVIAVRRGVFHDPKGSKRRSAAVQ